MTTQIEESQISIITILTYIEEIYKHLDLDNLILLSLLSSDCYKMVRNYSKYYTIIIGYRYVFDKFDFLFLYNYNMSIEEFVKYWEILKIKDFREKEETLINIFDNFFGAYTEEKVIAFMSEDLITFEDKTLEFFISRKFLRLLIEHNSKHLELFLITCSPNNEVRGRFDTIISDDLHIESKCKLFEMTIFTDIWTEEQVSEILQYNLDNIPVGVYYTYCIFDSVVYLCINNMRVDNDNLSVAFEANITESIDDLIRMYTRKSRGKISEEKYLEITEIYFKEI